MVNRKGVIKTLEAVIAVVIILAFIYILLSQQQPAYTGQVPGDIAATQAFLLDQITYHEPYRSCLLSPTTGIGDCSALSGCMTTVVQFIQDHTPAGYQSTCELCKTATSCMTTTVPLTSSIYAESVFVAGKDPKILRIYFWIQT